MDKNKKESTPKNLRKGKRSSKKEKLKLILEIPVLVEDLRNKEKEKSRDLFFYDVPKFWTEEDIRTNISKIGKVLRIQVRQQYKYKSVRIQIILNKNFESMFNNDAFGICISNHYLR